MSYSVLVYDKLPFIRDVFEDALLKKHPKASFCFVETFDEFLNQLLNFKFNLIIYDFTNEKDEIFQIKSAVFSIFFYDNNLVFNSDSYMDFIQKKIYLSNLIFLNKSDVKMDSTILVNDLVYINLSDSLCFELFVSIYAKGNNILSTRELECTLLLMEGLSNVEIAQKTSLSTTAISTFKKRILYKSKSKNIVELTRLLNYMDHLLIK